MTDNNNFLNDLDSWVLDALQKTAEAATTSHPSGSAEDGDQPASEGSRSAENTADVKADVPDSVDAAKETDVEGAGRGENAPCQVAANAKATGEDPANETASVKGQPSDPGTSMPAKADMGEKYSAAQLLTVGDDILQSIAGAEAIEVEKTASAEAPAEETPAEAPVEAPVAEKSAADAPCDEKKDEAKADEKPAEEKKEDDKEMKEAEYAGQVAAAALIEQLKKSGAAKAEATPEVSQEQVIDSIVKNAAADASSVAEYLAMQKAAMGGEAAPEEVAALVDAAGADGGEAPVDPAAMAGPEAMPPVDPAMLGAEAGPEGMGGGMEGGGDAEIEALVEALVEAGVNPEELMALADESGGAEMGGAPAEVPAEAPVEAPAVEEELAAVEEPKVASFNKEAWSKLSKDQKKGQLAATLAGLIG